MNGLPADRPVSSVPSVPAVAAPARRGRARPWLLALLTLAPIGPAARAAPPGPEPCVWHVRLDYHYRDAGAPGEHDTRVRLAFEAPMRCAGSGMETIVIPDGPVRARGSAQVHRDVPAPGGTAGARDISDKEAVWPAPDGGAPVIEAPAPSFVGTGYGTKVILAAALASAPRRAASAPPVFAAAPDAPTPAMASHPQGLTTVIEPEADPDHLHLELFFDPSPGAPSDPSGALARVPERTRAALASPGGEAALALKGHFFGALTQITPEGDFSICYQRTLELSPARVAVDFCGWLTRGARDWSPARLPVVDAAPDLKSDTPPPPLR